MSEDSTITTQTSGVNSQEHVVTILDIDQPSLSVNDRVVNEGSSTTVTVSLTGAYTSAVTVDYHLTGVTAVAGTDYTDMSGTLTIPAGSTTATFSVATTNNPAVCETDKTLKVILTNPTNATLGDDEGLVTIKDITNPSITLSSSTYSVTEGSDASVIVNMSAICATRTVTVNYSTTAGTATSTTDFAPALNAMLTIAAGDSSGTISIPTVDDSLDEDDETFTVTIATPVNASLGATTSATVTIQDNDAAPSVTLSASSNSVSESDTSVTLTATLSAASGKSISLPFTVTGTATVTSDYTITASPLSITAGSTTATITITLVDDSAQESNETVIVTLDTPTNASLGATYAQTVTIVDNDLGSFNISGITGDNESTNDAYLSNGVNPKVNWGTSVSATGYKISIVSDDQSTTVCAEQTVGAVTTYQFSTGDCSLTAGNYYRAQVKSTLGSVEHTASNNNYRFFVNHSPSLASNGEGPWYVMAGSSITINAVGGNSPTIGVASDADGDAIEFTATGTGTLGTVTPGTTSFTYAATSGAANHGRDAITYTISDSHGGTRTGTIYIHVMQAYTWTGMTNATWSTGSNWCGSIASGNRACAGGSTAPGAASTSLVLYFDQTCTSTFSCSPTTTSNISVQGIKVKGSGFTQNTGHTITVGSDGWVQSGGTFTGGNSQISTIFLQVSGGLFHSTSGVLSLGSLACTNVNLLNISNKDYFDHNSGTVKSVQTRSAGGSCHSTGSFTLPSDLELYNFEVEASLSGAGWYAYITSTNGNTINIENNLTLSGGVIQTNFNLKRNLVVNANTACDWIAPRYINMIGTVDQTYSADTGAGCSPGIVVNKDSGEVKPTVGLTAFYTRRLDVQKANFQSLSTGTLKIGLNTCDSETVLKENFGTGNFVVNGSKVHIESGRGYGSGCSTTTTINLNPAFAFNDLELLGHASTGGWGGNLNSTNPLIINGTFTRSGYRLNTTVYFRGVNYVEKSNYSEAFPTSGILYFDRGSAQTYTCTGCSASYYDKIYITSGSTLTLNTNMSVLPATTGDLEVTNGTLNLNTYSLTVSDIFRIGSSGVLNVGGGSYTPNSGGKYIVDPGGTVNP